MINSKADLDSLPALEKAQFLQQLANSTNSWEWDENAQDWVLKENWSSIERLGLTLDNLPDPIIAPKPEPRIPTPPQSQPLAASIDALTQGTDANAVFSWMALQGLSNVAAATARNDINMNLLGLPSLWLSEGDGRLMASTGLDTAFAMLWDAVDTIPEGYQDIVAAWRSEYHLTAG